MIAALLLFSYGYDLLSALYPDAHVLSLSPQYRLWTWLLFYLTGQLFAIRRSRRGSAAKRGQGRGDCDTVHLSLHMVLRTALLFALFKADRNAFILTGSQIYILIIAR